MRKVEISRIYYEGTNYLEHIDNLYLTEETLQIKKMLNKIENFKVTLKQTGATPKNVTALFSNPHPLPLRFAFVSSSSYLIATEQDVTINNKKPVKIHIPHLNRSSYQDFKELTKVMVKLQKWFLCAVNGIHIPAKQSTEFDILANSTGQTNSEEMIQKSYEYNGSITEFGFGKYRSTVFSYFFSMFDPKYLDYGLVYAWGKWSLGLNFINRLYSHINQNTLGLKVMVFFSEDKQIFPPEAASNKSILSYVNSINDSSNDEKVRVCKWQGEDYYMMGFKGQKNVATKLVGLYPIRKIETKISFMKQKFILF